MFLGITFGGNYFLREESAFRNREHQWEFELEGCLIKKTVKNIA